MPYSNYPTKFLGDIEDDVLGIGKRQQTEMLILLGFRFGNQKQLFRKPTSVKLFFFLNSH